MSTTSVSLQIAAPVETVFQAISEIESFTQRTSVITDVEFLTEQTSGVGTVFRETRLHNGKETQTELTVTEFVPNERIRMVTDQGGTIWDTIFVVSPTDSGAQLEMTMDAKAYKFYSRLINPMIKGMVRKLIVQDMEELKAYCEARVNSG